MWEFEKYTSTPAPIPKSAIMTARSGLEARYADRFNKYVGTTDENLRWADKARSTTDSLRTALGVIDTQKENVEELFIEAEMMVKMIDDFQRESGVKQVRNIPLAGESIRTSPSRKLGYVKLSMKFIAAGMLNFMETALSMEHDIRQRDMIIKAIGDEHVDVPVIGRLTEINPDDMSSDGPIIETKIPLDVSSDTDSVTGSGSTAPTTPSKTPVKDASLAKKGSPNKTPPPVLRPSTPVVQKNSIKK